MSAIQNEQAKEFLLKAEDLMKQENMQKQSPMLRLA
jgi:hypothetical protein